MFVLVDLEMEGFGPFVEKARISFPNNGSILVRGQWTNKPISSGTGKSHVMKGVAFAGGYCDVPATELKNWDSKKFSVKLRIKDTVTDDIITILREPKLKLFINDVPLEGTSEASEEKLKSIFKLPSDLVRVLTYRPQKKPGEFLNSTDSQKKEFLSTLLELDKFELAKDKSEEEYKDVCGQLSLINHSITNIENLLPSLASNDIAVQESLHNIEKEQQKITELNQSLAEKTAKIKSLQTNNSTTETDTKVADLETTLREYQLESQTLNAQKNKIQSITNQITYSKTQLSTIQAEAQKITAEINSLKANGKCPTCLQDWDKHQDFIEKKKQAVSELLQKYQDIAKFITENENAKLELPTIDSRLAMLMDFTRTVNEQLANIKAEAKMALMPLQSLISEVSSINALIKASDTTILSQQSLIKELESKQKLKQQKVTELEKLEKQKEELSDEKVALEFIMKVLGRTGFMSAIFEEVLADIEARANVMIARIPNIELLTLSIRSFSTNAKGAVQNKIDIKAYKAGKEISLKNLSGGQICALELCTDLAIRECIRQRSGAPFAWLALDEAMDGLDVETKKPTLEMIQELVSGQVIVIDHATEIKENFENIITIEYDGSQSRVL